MADAPITRDPDYPPEAAALVAAFSKIADGSDVVNVLDAAANFFIMALVHNAKRRHLTLAQAESGARLICKNVVQGVATQWNRQPKSDDQPVRDQ